MKKLLIITPHLSTGGAPQVTVNKIELLQNDFDIKVIEWNLIAWAFVVQRNRIIKLVGEQNFYSLGENKLEQLSAIIGQFNPDTISMEEFPEMFMNEECANYLYNSDRTWRIVETTHDSSFNPRHKTLFPDISRFDPVARVIGLRPGQVCHIIRPSKTAIEANYYRVCI